MGLFGNLKTMALPELLEWVAEHHKTGTLEVEKGNICKRIMFDGGQVTGCSSNDPATFLGQFLLSRGKITGDVLKEALSRQESNGKNLAAILIDMQAISGTDQSEFVQAKIEETIFGLFDWDDASFRFYADALPDPNIVEVNLEIGEILERGRQRSDELEVSRQSIKDNGIVLRPTTPQPDLGGNKSAERLFSLIDGKRTVADLLLHSHAPEFQVKRFLSIILDKGLVEIVEPDEAELPQVAAVQQEAQETLAAVAGASPRAEPQQDQPSAGSMVAPAEPQPSTENRELQSEIKMALNLMSSGKADGALELLSAMVKAHPNDVALRQLVTNAEKDFWSQTIADDMPLESVLSAVAPLDGGSSKRLGPEESFLLEKIDGKADARTVIWLAPMRKVDALRTLCRMLKNGIIEKRAPAA